MNTQFLLPCTCGRKIQVQLRQAGEIVTCECGNSVEVPTLSGLKRLEAVKEPAAPKNIQHQWTVGHALIFVGVLIILVAIGFCGRLLWYGPSDPFANFTPEGMIQAAQSRTPLQSLRLWQMLVRGGLEHHKRGAEIYYEDEQKKHAVLWWLWSLLPISGVGLIAAGFIVLQFKKKKPRETARV
jgi:hypothetical protein